MAVGLASSQQAAFNKPFGPVADHSDSLLKAPQENKIEATLTFSRQ
jgi:hypothetical protein